MTDTRPLVQWSFLQVKKFKNTTSPLPCCLHSSTQIGSKILLYGGLNNNGDGTNQLLLYDTVSYLWNVPDNHNEYQEAHPNNRYGHSLTLIEMHPPKIMLYGGMQTGGAFEFEAPDSMEQDGDDTNRANAGRDFMFLRRRGKKSNVIETTDDAVYFLTLNSDHWVWSKPIVSGNAQSNPAARTEHSACKTGTNEVTVFGGWVEGPTNDVWAFNYVDMEWVSVATSGILPRPRYRHTAEVIGFGMYILGGSDNNTDEAEDGAEYLGIHRLDLETLQWSHPDITGENPFPRSGHSSALIGAQSIAIFGGKLNKNIFYNDLVLINTETLVGTKVRVAENQIPTPVANTTLTTVGNKCFVFGGTDVKHTNYNDIRSVDIGPYLSDDDITVGEGASSDYNFKILIIGDAGVGKSALLTRFSENAFLPSYQSTIGIDFNSRMIRVDKTICKLEIWDTAGQERFSTITANYYRGAQGALLVYDVTSRDSYEHVKNWYERAKQLGGEDLECVLIGNKIDLELLNRQVTKAEGDALAVGLNIPFIETSALNGSNVENAFVSMTRAIKSSLDRRGLSGIKNNNMKNAGGVQLASTEKRSGQCASCSIG